MSSQVVSLDDVEFERVKAEFLKDSEKSVTEEFFNLDEIRRELVEDLAQEIQDDLELNDLENELDDLSSDDSSDEENLNTIGNVPLEWYKNEDIIGYDVHGRKIVSTKKDFSAIDKFLNQAGNPDAWRTIEDPKNNRSVVLSDRDLQLIRRIRQGNYPTNRIDPYEMPPENDSLETKIHPLTNRLRSKASFLPSINDRRRVERLLMKIRTGRIKPPKPPKPEVFDCWAEDNDEIRRPKLQQIPPPRMPLPSHGSSYNPPEEYLYDEEEKETWISLDETERPISHLPQKFSSLREVPCFDQFIQEQFHRCLDMYMCPRILKNKLNADPESMLPRLPSPKDLRPFPEQVAIVYKGHQDRVRSVALDSTGRWLATGCDDGNLRIFNLASGRMHRRIPFSRFANREKTTVSCVKFHPRLPILAVAAEDCLYLVDPKLRGTSEIRREFEEERRKLLKVDEISEEDEILELLTLREYEKVEEEKKKERRYDEEEDPRRREFEEKVELEKSEAADEGQNIDVDTTVESKSREARTQWEEVQNSDRLYEFGCRLRLKQSAAVERLDWHKKGHYLVSISRNADPGRQCILHSLKSQKSMKLFSKVKGGITECSFHPTEPYLVVCTKRHTKVFDLQTQKLVKAFISSAKWLNSISIHPSGNHICLGSYDRKVVWYDMDLGKTPYKTLRFHDKAIRQVQFHPKLPLLASASDDGTCHVMHTQVFSDWSRNPIICPLKKLRFHSLENETQLGVQALFWHPTQPWLITCGADGQVALWV